MSNSIVKCKLLGGDICSPQPMWSIQTTIKHAKIPVLLTYKYVNKTGFLELKYATIDFYMHSINVHTYYDVADSQLNHVETKNVQLCIRYKDFEL